MWIIRHYIKIKTIYHGIYIINIKLWSLIYIRKYNFFSKQFSIYLHAFIYAVFFISLLNI